MIIFRYTLGQSHRAPSWADQPSASDKWVQGFLRKWKSHVINDIGTNLSSFLITTVANRNYVGPSNMDGFPGKSRHFIGHWDSHPQITGNWVQLTNSYFHLSPRSNLQILKRGNAGFVGGGMNQTIRVNGDWRSVVSSTGHSMSNILFVKFFGHNGRRGILTPWNSFQIKFSVPSQLYWCVFQRRKVDIWDHVRTVILKVHLPIPRVTPSQLWI